MIALVLGGTRSGKSVVAERLVAELAAGVPVTYLATAVPVPGDDDHRARIAAHVARRPPSWCTVECARPGDLPAAVAGAGGAVLVDSLGTWVALHDDLAVDPAPLVEALRARAAAGRATVLVSEEVGLSVHAPTAVGRAFVDALGLVNQAVAAVADRAVLVVAGWTTELTPPPSEHPC